MPSTFLGIETSRRGLQAHQQSLETTGHNIANANTEGYSRQEAVHTASDPYTNPTLSSTMTPGQLGTGVEVNEIRRIRNEYLDDQARESTSSLSYWQIQEDIMSRVEAVFSEPSASGISDKLTDFFNTWQDLNNTPEDAGVKSTVVELGGSLADMLNETYAQLSTIGDNICELDSGNNVTGGEMADDLDNIKDIITQIKDVSDAIKKIKLQGNQPNDLLDKRDLLIDQLAEYGPVNVVNNSSATGTTDNIQIEFFGFNLTNIHTETITFTYTPADTTTDPANPVPDEISLSINGQDVSLSGTSGKLAGLEKMRSYLSNQVDGLKENLNDFAETLKEQIYNLIQPSNMFSGSLDGTSGKFQVEDDIVDDEDVGYKAIDVARLYSADISDLGDMSFNDYYNGLLAQVGAVSDSASSMTENQTAINQQLTSLRESASGVSLDEELSLLIQYQYGYQASAKVMSTIDGMIDYLINRIE